ncbi:MAG: hypothetical protein JWN64_253 [Parcubacteria group bacterium]|nr:hypothetical protein [Parcubacteria group bacterium]
MNHLIQKTFAHLQEIRLSVSTRESIRSKLAAYADMHPMFAKPVSTFIPIFSSWQFRAGVSTLLVVLLVGSSATFAAEKAVPGDALYSLKVGVNEPFTLALANTPEERAHALAKRADRRIEEALALAEEGKLDEEKATYLAAQFSEHVDASVTEANKAEETGGDGASIAVRAELEQHLLARAEDLHALAVVQSDEANTATDDLTKQVEEKATLASAALDRVEAGVVPDVTSAAVATLRESLGHDQADAKVLIQTGVIGIDTPVATSTASSTMEVEASATSTESTATPKQSWWSFKANGF